LTLPRGIGEARRAALLAKCSRAARRSWRRSTPPTSLGFYSGDNAEATITTQEFGATDGSLTRISEAMPVIDTQSALLSLGARMRRSPDDVVVWTAEGAQSANTGIVRKRSRARYHSFRLRVPENVVWTHAQGVTHNGVPAGVR
jgi:hypothetical protein